MDSTTTFCDTLDSTTTPMTGRTTLNEALTKLQRFCASRDRCHSEVRTKLISLKVYGDDLEEIISQLITDGFLNEERFAKSYARGKFRISRWGRTKILYGLRSKKVADYCIQKGLQEIDEEEYIAVLDDLIGKKLKGESSFEAKRKVVASLQGKGFEQGLILERMKAIKVKM